MQGQGGKAFFFNESRYPIQRLTNRRRYNFLFTCPDNMHHLHTHLTSHMYHTDLGPVLHPSISLVHLPAWRVIYVHPERISKHPYYSRIEKGHCNTHIFKIKLTYSSTTVSKKVHHVLWPCNGFSLP